MVRFTIRQLCPWGAHRYLLNRKVGDPESPSGRFGKKKSLAAAESQSPVRPAHSLVTTLTEITRLPLSWYDTQHCIYTDENTQMAGFVNRELGYIYLLSMQVYFLS